MKGYGDPAPHSPRDEHRRVIGRHAYLFRCGPTSAPVLAGSMGIRKSPVPARLPWWQNIKRESSVPCSTVLTRRSRIEVPRVDYEKLSGDRVGESSEAIRARVQAARNI
jgi:hypothetical protein